MYQPLLDLSSDLNRLFLGKSHTNREALLSRKEEGPFFIYTSPKRPTDEQKIIGMQALKSWKSADRDERNTLVDSIVAGNVLQGMTKKAAIEYLGQSEDAHPYRFDGAEDGLFYDVTQDEGSCFFCVAVIDGRISDVYLKVNN